MFSYKTISGIFFVLCLIFAVLLGALIYVARERTELIIDELSIDRVEASKQGFDNFLVDLSEKAMSRGNLLSNQKRLIDAIREYEKSGLVLDSENTDFPQYNAIYSLINEFLEGYDFISITDKNGVALARTDNGEREYPLPKNGYSLMSNPDVRQVFDTGDPVASLSFMLDNTTLVVTTLYPIYDEGELLGIITCLFDLTNPKHLTTYKQQSGSEVAIFLGHEEFVSTLRYSDNPVELIAGASVIEAIFEDGADTYISFKPIAGTIYGTAFSPLIYHGEIIGMLFTGIDVNSAMAISTEMDVFIALIALLAFVIAAIFVLIIQRYNRMVKGQITMQGLMTSISQSFLSDGDLDTLITNAFAEIGPHMNVSQILMFKEKPGDASLFTCTNEWLDPSMYLESRIGTELSTPKVLFEAYMKLRSDNNFYISSDDKKVKTALAPYRMFYTNYLSTCIFLDDRVYAFVDFSREKARGKWRREDINAATFVSNTLTGAFHKKRVEEQLVAAKEVAELSNQYKSAFLANVSHEIRTPMNAILGITEIYLQDKSSWDNIEDGLTMIYDSGNLLLGIINDILDLSKIEAGRMEIIPVRYDVPSLINDTVQLSRLRYGSKPIEFILDVDKRTPITLMGDELRIRQILNNILSNAFKYTDHGRIELLVSAGTVESNDVAVETDMMPQTDAPLEADENTTLIFCVKDTGQGMTQEQLDVIFDEFTRFNMEINRTTVGTGLGMSITKRLLDLMDGEIQIESEPNVGSTFTVRIPQKRVDNLECGPEMSAQLNSFRFHSMSIHKKSQVICEYMPYGSVLVVDDVESNLYVSRGMLIPYGLKIDTATSGFEAIDYISSGKTYDIIFMDHMMPRMDGIEAVRNIREMGYKGYIIALTANALVGHEEMFLSNGFDGYIPKPIDTRELNSVLVEYIRNKKPHEVVNAAREEAREAELLRALENANLSVEPDTSDELLNDVPGVKESFILDAENALDVLGKACKNMESGSEVDIGMYRITVHGMKTALLFIDERELSDFAISLEKAALNNELDVMREKTPEFIRALETVLSKISS